MAPSRPVENVAPAAAADPPSVAGEDTAARAALAPPEPAYAAQPAAQGPVGAQGAEQGPSPHRVAPGSRTLLGVAPGAPPQAGLEMVRTPTPESGGAAAAVVAGNPGQSPDSGVDEEEEASESGGVRETVAEVAEAPAAPKRRARAVLAVVFAVLGVLGIAAVVIGYFVLVRYTPLAARHIPAASNVAVRADPRQIGTFEPVRKHLWPVLFDKPSKTAGKTLSDRIAQETGYNPTLDVREVIVASVDSKSWVALIGGNFKPGRFVPGMEKALHEEGYSDWHKSGELLVGPSGMAMGQADDGTLVLGTEAEIVTASLPSSEEYKRMDLPEEGAVSFAVSKEAFEELARDTGAFDPSGAMKRIRHLKGTLALSAEPSMVLDLEPKGGENAETLGRDLETFLGRLRLGLVLVPDQMGEKTALSSTKVTVENEHVMVRGTWPLDGLERGCQKLAGLLGPK